MAGLARRENEAVDCGPEDLDPGKVLLFYRVAEPDPVEPKLFRGTVPEPLLAILAPAPRLRSRNYLFNKYFTILSSVWRIPG